ncbi:tetratricopeptide repeat protein [Streptomyces sp. PKU-EA00015]|uniref:AfsR/SARP family transcriptional regulator n=1 Tax=Streptomyces sp. PKU-EA00015 TaxID=2748326 RepID=UPI0015A40AE8|nr:BTAD domain-containing putative transcriptional regulator [Streptomyces sp. PKU-EA00015]NWF27095.1 tetratricopeptide repeat protein [Streptomyces sp. PKU-EA00015]
MRFGLLGAPAVHDAAGEPQHLGSAKIRALLATLLLRPNKVVPVDELKAALWGDEPPASAHASLHNHVTRLRRILAEEGRLRAVAPGYVLRVAPGELDTEVFEEQVRTAHAAYGRGEWAAVVAAARDGLALWRGSPLAGVYGPDEAEPALVRRLRESRLLLLEWRYDAELALGRHDGLGPELSALVAEFPLREAFHRQLMLVLHRTGRQAEALDVYRSLRRTLVEELGVDPGPAVRQAHEEVLRGPVAKSPPPQSIPPQVPERRPPAQLPPGPVHFTGRAETVAALRTALAGGGAVVVVSGMAGVGKSALAAHVAHTLREEFPDGQLYLNLHGATPGMTPLEAPQAVAALLRDLGVGPLQMPEAPDAATALLRSVLAPTRTLLVLDDAASAAQVRPLLPAGPGCAVVVTSRSPLTALDGARRFPLAPLSAGDSEQLVRAVSGRGPGERLDRLVELCGRLPLALRVVGARLAARSALTPDVLAGLLDAEAGRLDHLDYDDLSVRGSLAVAHDGLDPDAALALRGLGAVDLPEYGVPAVARLMDTDEPRAAAALDRLVEVALLQEVSYGRFVPHDLVRDYARELAERAGGTEAAVERVLRWYGERARQAALTLSPVGSDTELRLPEPIGEAEPFSCGDTALAWCDCEVANAVALTERYAFASRTVPLLVRAWSLLLRHRGRLQELAVVGRIALDAARAHGDAESEANALSDLAGLHFLSGRPDRALPLNEGALAAWRALGNERRMQRSLSNQGLLLEALGRYEEAAEVLRESLEIVHRMDDAYAEGVVLIALGNLYEHTDARAAIGHHERALEIGVRLGGDVLVQTSHCNIGYAHLTLGEPAAALRHFEECLRILGDDGPWHGESQCRVGLVRALRGLGRDEEAAVECARLLESAQARADAQMVGLARHQRGLLLRSAGRVGEAREQWRAAVRTLEAFDGAHQKTLAELRELLRLTASQPDAPALWTPQPEADHRFADGA